VHLSQTRACCFSPNNACTEPIFGSVTIDGFFWFEVKNVGVDAIALLQRSVEHGGNYHGFFIGVRACELQSTVQGSLGFFSASDLDRGSSAQCAFIR
jgi:hypothetical protein